VKYSKILILLGIGCVAGLLLVFGVRLQAQNKIKVESIAASTNEIPPEAMQRIEQFRNRQQGSNWGAQGRQQASRWGGQQRSDSSKSDNNSEFYRVIVDNSLFRPLGWRPPNKEPEYTLLGTAFVPNGGLSKALVEERRSDKFYVAGVGDKIGDAIIKEIQEDKITLDKNGEMITLRGENSPFLKSGGSRRSSSRSESSNRDEGNASKSDNEDAIRKARESAEQKMRQEMMKRAEQMRRQFQNASREQRERMIREFRGRRGRGR
jgi:hypothetical protein